MEEQYYQAMADQELEERKLGAIPEPTDHWREVIDTMGVISIRRLFNSVKKDEGN